jgi:3-phytase
MRYANKLAFAIALTCGYASAAVVTTEDLLNTNVITTNGNTEAINTDDGTRLRLTSGSQGGSAFSSIKVSTEDFRAFFEVKANDGDEDGIAFVIQPASIDGNSPTIGVVFKMGGNKVSININGESKGSADVNIPSGDTWHIWIDYANSQLEVRVHGTGDRPLNPSLIHSLNISQQLGGLSQAEIGFTAGTGTASYDLLTLWYTGFSEQSRFNQINAEPCIVYGVDDEGLNDSQLFTVNPFTRNVNELGARHDGCDIEDLAIHPTTYKLYASSGKNATSPCSPGMLYEVDKQTGDLTTIGTCRIDNQDINDLDSLAFNPLSSTLYGWAKGHGLVTIDTGTGDCTCIFDDSLNEVEAMTWDVDGTLYYAAEGDSTLLTYPPPAESCQLPSNQVEAMEWIAGKLYFSIHNNTKRQLYELNLHNCTDVRQTVIKKDFDDIEGIAAPQKPCLDLRENAVLVKATVETDPVPSGGDAADDIAIWVHPSDSALSTVIGTNKRGGLLVYDLTGTEIQYLPDGNMNNVDLRYDFPLGTENVALVAASDRTKDGIALYKVNTMSRELEKVADISGVLTGKKEPYGLCMYRSSSDQYYVFVNNKDGDVEQWEVSDDGNGSIDATLKRSFDVGTQTEGCVADDQLGKFYIGEENVGIWKYNAEPTGGTDRVSVDKTKSAGGHIIPEVEGLTIYKWGEGSGYLIASNQKHGSGLPSTYTIYNRSGNNEFLGTFQIVANGSIDGVSDTDGIDVASVPLGLDFPFGVFIAQDGENTGGNQNFKLVPWQKIALPLNLRWH